MTRLCANPDTLAAYRASRPPPAEEIARLRAELAEAKAEIDRLQEASRSHLNLGLTPVEDRIYTALKIAGGVVSRDALAEAASTPRHGVHPATVCTIIGRLRKVLAAADEPWTIDGIKGGRWTGGGYRLVRVEVAA